MLINTRLVKKSVWTGFVLILAFLFTDVVPSSGQTLTVASITDSLTYSVPDSGSKSRWKAALLSLAVPGLGEIYAGSWARARIFLAAEGAAWAGFAGLRVYGSWRADDYRVFAAEHAGVRLNGQSDTYFRHIGGYSSSDVYNFQELLTQRDRARLYSEEDAWVWESDAARKSYLNIRRSSRRAKLRSVYILGFGMVTRLISAVDAAKIAGGANSGDSSSSMNLYLTPDGGIYLLSGVRF